MTGIAVCDSACIIALSTVDRLELLRDAYARVLIPGAVRAEVSRHPIDCFEVRDPSDLEAVSRLSSRIHRAEASVIALTREIPAAEVVLDDYEARRIAGELGLKMIGTIGLIVRAKARGKNSEDQTDP